MLESTCFTLLSLFSILILLRTLLLYLFHCYSQNISLTNRPIGPSTRCTSNHVLQHGSCRGSFIAYETCIRWIFINHFSPAVQFNMRVLSTNLQLLKQCTFWQHFSARDRALVLKYKQFVLEYCLSITPKNVDNATFLFFS